MSSSSHREEGGVNIRGPAPPRRWRMVLLDSSDDDRAAMLPPSTTEMPSPATHAREKMREMHRA